GGTLILFLGRVGWVLNLGNRLNVVARLHAGRSPYFTGFRPWTSTLMRGCISASAIATYLSPAAAFGALAYYAHAKTVAPPIVAILGAASAATMVLAVFTLPGCMTVFAGEGDATRFRDSVRAFCRVWLRRHVYLRAWAIALVSVSLSFVGVLGALIGFLYTSVWSWDVVGYAFTVAMYLPLDQTRHA